MFLMKQIKGIAKQSAKLIIYVTVVLTILSGRTVAMEGVRGDFTDRIPTGKLPEALGDAQKRLERRKKRSQRDR